MDGYSTRFYTCLPDRVYETHSVFSTKLSETDEDSPDGVDCDETLTEKKKEVVVVLCKRLHFILMDKSCVDRATMVKNRMWCCRRERSVLRPFMSYTTFSCTVKVVHIFQKSKKDLGSQSSDDTDTGGGLVSVNSRVLSQRKTRAEGKQKAKEDSEKVYFVFVVCP